MAEAAFPPAFEFRPGSLFRQYQLLEQIGTGGQGIVWSARDQNEGRIVAIKFSEIGDSDQERAYNEMLNLQAAKLVGLRHPFILPLYEVGLSGRIRYFVSRYASGGTLLQKLSSGPLEIGEALRCASEIAAALTFLHEQGIIHRDLKSSNVLTDLNRNAYLSDFGIARFLSDSTQALHTGRGTPIYAPPEQHKMAAISPQSDIYSFGILLYELFTGHLPWDGETALGIRQLYSAEELPDPRQVNPDLPPALTAALRRLTAAEPADRPASAAEALETVCAAFGLPPVPPPPAASRDEAAILEQDVQELLRHSLPRWESDTRASLSLTKFALVSEYYRRLGSSQTIPEPLDGFLLYHALIFGFDHSLWWQQIVSPTRRLAIAGEILRRGGTRSLTLTLGLLESEPPAGLPAESIPPRLVETLLELAASRQEALELLRRLSAPSPAWRETAFGGERDAHLARLALEDSDRGDEAAHLIGHLRSETAVRLLSSAEDRQRGAAALQIVLAAAGSLPSSLPVPFRRRIALAWLLDQALDQPLNLLAVYALAFLGALLGFGLQAYLTAHVPTFWEARHIILSLERGAIFGAPFALGILVMRVIMERFHRLPWPARLGAASILGALLLNLAVFMYDVFVLNAPPTGFLVSAACLLIALGFSTAALIRRRLARMLISGLTLFAALAGAWWAHLAWMTASPLLFFDYTWPAAPIVGTLLLVAAPIAVLGNLLRLAPEDEAR